MADAWPLTSALYAPHPEVQPQTTADIRCTNRVRSVWAGSRCSIEAQGDRMSRMVYYLPRTTLIASGVVETRMEGKTRKRCSASLDLDQGVEADPDDYFFLDLDNDWWESTNVSLSLTPDGRLTNAKQASEGIGPKIVHSAVSVAASVAGAILPGATFAANDEDDKDDEDDTKATEHETQRESPKVDTAREDTCMEDARQQLKKVCSKRLSIVGVVLDNCGDAVEAAAALKALQKIEQVLCRQIATIDAARQAREDAVSAPQFRPYSITLRTADLIPIADEHEAPPLPTRNPMLHLYELTGCVVTIERPTPVLIGYSDLDSEQAGAALRSTLPGIAYRHGYTATVRVHRDTSSPTGSGTKAAGTAGNATFAIEQTFEIQIVDNRSPVGVVPLDGGLFSNESSSVTFHDNGTIATVGTTAAAAAGAVADAVADIPATVADALGSAATTRGHINTLRNAERNFALAKLQTQKATIEAAISSSTPMAATQLIEKRAAVGAEIDRLAAERPPATATASAPSKP